jgi:hypothetical protein
VLNYTLFRPSDTELSNNRAHTLSEVIRGWSIVAARVGPLNPPILGDFELVCAWGVFSFFVISLPIY